VIVSIQSLNKGVNLLSISLLNLQISAKYEMQLVDNFQLRGIIHHDPEAVRCVEHGKHSIQASCSCGDAAQQIGREVNLRQVNAFK